MKHNEMQRLTVKMYSLLLNASGVYEWIEGNLPPKKIKELLPGFKGCHADLVKAIKDAQRLGIHELRMRDLMDDDDDCECPECINETRD